MGQPDAGRDQDRRARAGGTVQPGDRRQAVLVPADRRYPRLPHPEEARRPLAYRHRPRGSLAHHRAEVIGGAMARKVCRADLLQGSSHDLPDTTVTAQRGAVAGFVGLGMERERAGPASPVRLPCAPSRRGDGGAMVRKACPVDLRGASHDLPDTTVTAQRGAVAGFVGLGMERERAGPASPVRLPCAPSRRGDGGAMVRKACPVDLRGGLTRSTGHDCDRAAGCGRWLRQDRNRTRA